MALNVNREIQDAFYRYKMPRLVTKVEGKGNGIKTVIPNMTDIAKALGRPPTYCTKFFGCELGAQTTLDGKNDRYIVNGSHEATKLQDLLDIFIKKFVLCEKCGNPETVLKVRAKMGMISSSCKACGHNFNLDMRHKLTTFILRNPSTQEGNDSSSTPMQKKDKKRSKEENTPDKKNIAKNDKRKDSDEKEEDVEWLTDVSDKAVEDRRIQELSSRAKAMTMDNDTEKSEDEKLAIFRKFLTIKKDNGKVSEEDEKEIVVEAERLEIGSKATKVLCETMLEDTNVACKIKEHRNLFLRFSANNKKAQKYLIGGIECLIAKNEIKLLPQTCKIFHELYDSDIVNEEVIIDWEKEQKKRTKYISKELANKVHKQCEPFLKWLQEAEEESDESEEEVQIAFDDRMRASGIKEKKEELNDGNAKEINKKEADENEVVDDDLDIDNI